MKFTTNSIVLAVLSYVSAALAALTGIGYFVENFFSTGYSMNFIAVVAVFLQLLAAAGYVIRGMFLANTENEKLLRTTFTLVILNLIITQGYSISQLYPMGMRAIASMIFSLVPSIFYLVFYSLGIYDSVNGHTSRNLMKILSIILMLFTVFSIMRTAYSMVLIYSAYASSLNSSFLLTVSSSLIGVITSIITVVTYIWLYFAAECEYEITEEN